MPNSQLVKQVYNQLFHVHEQWFEGARLVKEYNIDITGVKRLQV